jgi:hypothetical protein
VIAGPVVARRPGGRKVRTSQGSAPGNARGPRSEGRGYGQCHRENTAGAARGVRKDVAGPCGKPKAKPWARLSRPSHLVRVKRWGKSPPPRWQHRGHGKPRAKQGQIGGKGWPGPFTSRPQGTALAPSGRLLEPRSDPGPRGMIAAPRRPIWSQLRLGHGHAATESGLQPHPPFFNTSEVALKKPAKTMLSQAGAFIISVLVGGFGIAAVVVSILILRRGKLYHRLKPEARPRLWVLILLLLLLAVFVVWFSVWMTWPGALVSRILLGLFGITFGVVGLTLKWFSPLVDSYIKRKGWPLR